MTKKLLLSKAVLNTQYMTNSTLVSPVKMEYGWNFSLFGLKMMTFDQKSVIKMTWWAHGGISKIFFLHHFSSSFLGQKFLKFHPYSILTGETRVEFVIYCVLSSSGTRYRTRANIIRGLYTFYPLFEIHLCTVTFGLMYG